MFRSALLASAVTLLGSVAFAQDAAAPNPEQMKLGQTTYALCMACHQPTGLGMAPMFPPLAKSEYVIGPADRVAAIVLKGVTGPLTVEGKPFGLIPMPPQEAALKDEAIAAVVTYVRNSFGNTAPGITAEEVAKVRARFASRTTSWTEAELKAWKSE